MARSFAPALVALVAMAGCYKDETKTSERPAAVRAVQGTLDLERPRPGAPDAGTAAGHSGDRYVLRAPGAEGSVAGQVKPASAEIKIVDTTGRRAARVNVAPGGAFTALLPALPGRGNIAFRLTASWRDAEPWRTEILASRASSARRAAEVRVPADDATPPTAQMLLHSDGRVISSVDPVRPDSDAPVRLTDPLVTLTAVTRDVDGGTGRIRASLKYERFCGVGRDPVRRRTRYFPASEIARVRLPPGSRAPTERRRRARVRLIAGGEGCVVRGKTWADATNASGLETFSDQIEFEYRR
jgi:hypothetical protein